ncbi:MAG: FKBP-type peptidyl-prolyl cis-trans isomerase [Nitrospiraceae bacterium]|nr:MAG: FKBP-type peptidyl-prolyl cis-trans isomerase [Nitrospiraceae bacterium]
MKYVIIAICNLFLLLGISWSDELQSKTPELKDRKDRISYSVGFQIGGDLKKEKTEIDPRAFLKGVKDALGGKNPDIDPQEMNTMLVDMKKKIIARQRFEQREMREKRLGEGKKFLAENAKKEGVISLPSGLQYKIINEGKGRKPGATDRVKVHYLGTLIDGTPFGSSYTKGKPELFYVNGVIKGVAEALQLMKEGSKWQLVIPHDLAFTGRGEFANKTVIYELELISIEPGG